MEYTTTVYINIQRRFQLENRTQPAGYKRSGYTECMGHNPLPLAFYPPLIYPGFPGLFIDLLRSGHAFVFIFVFILVHSLYTTYFP